MGHIAPILNWKLFRACRKQKKDFKYELRKAILNELDIKMPKTDHAIAEEPFLLLGYGINAYFDIMISLSYLCLIIMIFLGPLFHYYSANEVKALDGSPGYYALKYTLGNLGGSSANCFLSKYEQASKIEMYCKNGGWFDTTAENAADLFHVGLINVDADKNNYCTEDGIKGDS